MPNHLNRARDIVLSWIRAEERSASFLLGKSDEELSELHGAIGREFLKSAEKAQFTCEILKAAADPSLFVVHWSYKGASFVGFKQPADEATPDDALLVSCAALLENDWCRNRLPK